eukprot:TRINITY_DN4922_c0_g1_i1.p1 TRINITY_DN4922_c0_g1~~TRINITY_DN4922_c0_g1_i1.p1  ORF type:complete len:414 (+),score=79.43 TRINITY_DN4922_c0_g1_i1:55-1296(+)
MCVNFNKVFTTIEMELKESPIKLISIDISDSPEFLTKEKITSYPTVILYINGNKYKYTGPLNSKSILTWTTKTIKQPFKLLTHSTLEEFNRLPYINKVVGYFDTQDVLFESFKAASNKISDYIFGAIVDPNEKIRLVYEFKDGTTGSWNMEEAYSLGFIEFLEVFGRNNITELDQQAIDRIVSFQIPTLIVFSEDDTDINLAEIEENIDIAKFAILTAGRSKFQELHSKWSIPPNEFPTAVLIRWTDDKTPIFVIYNSQLNVPFTSTSAVDFAIKAMSGEYVGYRKSEPINEEDLIGPVVKIVGNNFEDIVFGSEQDVVVLFYQTWCGHCIKLLPVYEELGNIYRNTNILITMIDTQKNGYPNTIGIKEFPTIMLFKKNYYDGIKLDTDLDLIEMVQFIEDNHSEDIIIREDN